MENTTSKSLWASFGPLQYTVIGICFLCNMLDGMDVLIISFTAPAIAKVWSISPNQLGLIFSSGLVGMTLGAVFLAPLADRFGRKPLMVSAALLMGSCIFLTASAENITFLLVYRLLSGMGIGVMMATTAALTAEYTPQHSRSFWVSMVVAGYPVGAVLTGLISVPIITQMGWEQLFRIAGISTLVVVPILLFFLKESEAFKTVIKKDAARVKELFDPKYKWGTFFLWCALFLSFTTLYFLINWIPKLASNAGLSMELALYSGMIFNLGAIVGIPIQGYLSSRYGLLKTVSGLMLATTLFLVVFGFFKGSNLLLFILFLLGFGVQGGFVGLYAVAAGFYPTSIRTTGVGWSIGIGRLGGILGPLLGGLLVSFGLDMTGSLMIFALPVLLAAVVTKRIKHKKEKAA
jgi:AAHS family 4-hydroxybenzoate transporter-like MFS transporter